MLCACACVWEVQQINEACSIHDTWANGGCVHGCRWEVQLVMYVLSECARALPGVCLWMKGAGQAYSVHGYSVRVRCVASQASSIAAGIGVRVCACGGGWRQMWQVGHEAGMGAWRVGM